MGIPQSGDVNHITKAKAENAPAKGDGVTTYVVWGWEWAWEELNLRPHAYQAPCVKRKPERCESPTTT